MYPQQVVYAVGSPLFCVFGVFPSLLIMRFLYWVIPSWLSSALSVGWVWATVEVYSKIEKKYFTKARSVPITAGILKGKIKTTSGCSCCYPSACIR